MTMSGTMAKDSAVEFHHVSVLPEAAELLVTDPDGIYVDCTLGGAGHSGRIAARLSPKGRLIGIDQDEAAIEAAGKHLNELKEQGVACQIDLVHDNFSHLPEILRGLELAEVGSVNGALFDLGVSSHQLDTAERGFSYMRDAALDMRMDPRQSLSAAVILNSWSEEELGRIFREYGEERWWKRIAQFIIARRKEKTFETTGELVDIIERAIPKGVRREQKGHPAKRIFQAVRIAVNDELGILRGAVEAAVRALKPGGQIAVITFHSLEDRIVKETLRELARGCICPPSLPVCVCGHKPEIKLLGKATPPSREEIGANPRAASAKLRRAVKL